MRIRTIRASKKEAFDMQVNDYLRLADDQGCVIEYIQITHLQDEYVATILFQQHVPEHEQRAPEFIEIPPPHPDAINNDVEIAVEGKIYSNVDAYEKY